MFAPTFGADPVQGVCAAFVRIGYALDTAMLAPARELNGLDPELVKVLHLFGMSETEMLIRLVP
jgi:hypothetical protein